MEKRDLIKAKEVAKILCVSESTFFRIAKNADFPKPFKPARVNLWDKQEILEYLEKSRAEVLAELED